MCPQVCVCQPPREQVQEPSGQHPPLRVQPRVPPAAQGHRGQRLHQRQLHRRIPVTQDNVMDKKHFLRFEAILY